MDRTVSDLIEQNRAWAQRRNRTDPEFFSRLAAQQKPQFLWIGCSDSRVPANEIVGLDPGEMFVHRNVANVVHTGDLNLLSVLEFAVHELRVQDIIVCGHYGCGGVRRALEDQGDALVDHWLAPIVELRRREAERLGEAGKDERIDRLCELNVALQVERVAATPILRAAWDRGHKVRLHGWIYGLKDGLIRDLKVSRQAR
jgi:carbonic anhydrase